MKCPKCSNHSMSIEECPDYPGLVAHCLCGFFKMQVENGPYKNPEDLLPWCGYCGQNRIKSRKSKFCSKNCYSDYMRKAPQGGASRKASFRKGVIAKEEGKILEDCPYECTSFMASSHRDAWYAGFRKEI